PRARNGTLSRISRKSNTSAQRRPRIGQNRVGLSQPLLLQRLQTAILLEFPDLPVDVLQQRRVALADDGAVVGLGAEAREDLELTRPLLDQHLERRPSLHHGVESLGEQVLMRGGKALVRLQLGVARLALRLQLGVERLRRLLAGAAELGADDLAAEVV